MLDLVTLGVAARPSSRPTAAFASRFWLCRVIIDEKPAIASMSRSSATSLAELYRSMHEDRSYIVSRRAAVLDLEKCALPYMPEGKAFPPPAKAHKLQEL